MEYTLQGIRNRVIIDKLDDEEFDPDIVDNFINEAQRDIFNQYELPFQEKIFKGTIPQGGTIIAFPTDVALVQSQIVTAPDTSPQDIANRYLDFRTFNQRYPDPSNNTPGPVGYWTLYGGNMLVSSPLDQDYTMTTYYIKRPKLLVVGTDVPEVPEEFGELLVLGAFKRIQERNEDYDLAAVTESKYNVLLNLLVSRYGFRRADGPIKMKNKQLRTR